MASSDSRQVTDEDAAGRAAEVAVELSEAEQPPDRGRLTRALNGVARSAGRVGRGTSLTKRGTDAASLGTGAAKRGTQAARRGAGTAGRGASSAGSWLAAQVVAMGPRLRIRDQATLRAQFPGRSDDEIAALLIQRAAVAAAAVGGATGAWAALPVLPAFPAEIAAETLAVVGIEIKLVGELHEILGVPAPGNAVERGRAYIGAWAHRRGVYAVPGGLLLVAGSPLARQLRRRLAGRVGRSAFSLGPLLTGALAGAMINRRETRKLGKDILEDLSRHSAQSNSAQSNAGELPARG